MLLSKKISYKEFDNRKKFLQLEYSPPPYNFSNGPSLSLSLHSRILSGPRLHFRQWFVTIGMSWGTFSDLMVADVTEKANVCPSAKFWRKNCGDYSQWINIEVTMKFLLNLMTS